MVAAGRLQGAIPCPTGEGEPAREPQLWTLGADRRGGDRARTFHGLVQWFRSNDPRPTRPQRLATTAWMASGS